MTFIDKVKEFLTSGRISKYGYMDALKDMVSPGNLKAMVDIFGISDKSKVLNESIKQQNDSSIFSLEKTKILEEEPNLHSPTVK